jgi:hypothetical protein
MMGFRLNEHGEKIATFKNVDNGDEIEKDCFAASINPPSKPHQELADAGLTDSNGLVDINKYTMQHNKFSNVFAFGDCISPIEHTRTQSAAVAQCPIVKNNIKNFLEGKELNGIYDGYTFLPFLVGHSYASSFTHHHDFEPSGMNHVVPHYGVFSNFYFGRMIANGLAQGESYSSFKKNMGPPYKHFNPRYPPAEHNDYIKRKGINMSEINKFDPKMLVEAHH